MQRDTLNYKPGEEYVELARSITEVSRYTLAEEFRIMLDKRAVELGMQPVQLRTLTGAAIQLEAVQ